MSFVLKRPFDFVAGNCWSAQLLSGQFPTSDSESDPSGSCLALREDGTDLGPPHTAHQIIEQEGCGRFSHWKGDFRFAASDNSDPNSNGRIYEVRWDSALYFDRRVQYAIDTLNSWARFLPGGLSCFVGRTVLEIGPGRDMGTALLMASLGASRVIAVDRFKGAWQDGWHDVFVDKLLGAAGRLGAPVDDGVMRQALAAKKLEVGPVEFLAEAFESVGDRFPDYFDVSVSHSTFEHFYSVEKAAAALAACMRRGSIGVHNVDFRDHANFGEPLKFLLIDDPAYADPKVNSDYGRGNRVRAGDMAGILGRAGFNRVEVHPDMKANADYLSRFIPTLEKSGGSRVNPSLEDLGILSATLVLRR